MLLFARPPASSLRVSFTPDAGRYSVRGCDGIESGEMAVKVLRARFGGPANLRLGPMTRVVIKSHVVHTAAQQLAPKYVIVMIGPDAQVKSPMSSALDNSIATSFLLLCG